MSKLIRLTIANIFRNNFSHEIFVKVYSPDVTGENVDLYVDKKAVW